MAMQNNSPADQLKALATQINKDYAGRDQRAVFPATEWKTLAATGIAAGCLPIAAGGLQLSHSGYAELLQQLGFEVEDNGLNFSIMAHALACLWPLHLHATSNEIRALLPAFASGEYILTNAMTETQGGSDVFNMGTTAVQQADGFILNGTKSFCTNAPVARYALVYAETSPGKGFFGGISAFLVDLKTPGVELGSQFNKMGLRTAAASAITFSNVKVPAHFAVGKTGAGAAIFQESMVLEKIFMAAAHTGTLQRWLSHMAHFAKQRTVGGNPIIKNQSVSHNLAEIKIELEAAKALVTEAVHRLQTGTIAAQVQYAAMVKYFVSTAMTTAAQKYLNLFGAQGYVSGNGIEVQVRDFMASTIYSGTSEVQKNIIASGGWN